MTRLEKGTATLLLVLYSELGVYLALRALMHLVSAAVNTLTLMSHCPA